MDPGTYRRGGRGAPLIWEPLPGENHQRNYYDYRKDADRSTPGPGHDRVDSFRIH